MTQGASRERSGMTASPSGLSTAIRSSFSNRIGSTSGRRLRAGRQEDQGDPLVVAIEIAVRLEPGMLVERPPGLLLAHAPALAMNDEPHHTFLAPPQEGPSHGVTQRSTGPR